MARQIKCPHCGSWNNHAGETCTVCGKPLLETTIRAEKKEKANFQEVAARLKAQSGWLDRFFENAKSGNIFMKSLAWILHAIWMVYFGILLFIAWLVTVVAG